MTRKTDSPTSAANASKGLTRRSLNKGLGALAASTAFGTFTIISRSARAAGPLRILCWPGYEEKDVIAEFEDLNKVKVEFKIYIGGEQMLQFFAQTPPGTFDAIISDAEYVQKLVAQDAVEAFPTAGLAELANYHPRFADFAPRIVVQKVMHSRNEPELLFQMLDQYIWACFQCYSCWDVCPAQNNPTTGEGPAG